MKGETKNTLVGVLLTMIYAIGGGIGLAILLIRPLGLVWSIITGVSFIVAGFICWGWACFVRNRLSN